MEFVAPTLGDLERWSRETRKERLALQLVEGELEVLEDLPVLEYYAALLRCAVRAKLVLEPEGMTEDDVGALHPHDGIRAARTLSKLINAALTVDPT